MRISFWPSSRHSWQEIQSLAAHVEAGGWDGFWLADHFMPNHEDVSRPCHEVFTLLSAVAATVPRIRVGSMVASNTYRHPAVLANMAASLDHVSQGRLVLGLGAGWQENEHHAYGLELYTLGERLRRLEEACQVVRDLFEQERSNFAGRYYQLDDAPLEPKPVQAHVPLMIGASGEKVSLGIVARQADEWNTWGDVDMFTHKASVLDRHCEVANRDPADIDRSVAVLIRYAETDSELASIDDDPSRGATLSGGTQALIDELGRYQDKGLDELIVADFNLPDGMRKRDMLDAFITNVAFQFQGQEQ
mgnify:CR=1 FL=1